MNQRMMRQPSGLLTDYEMQRYRYVEPNIAIEKTFHTRAVQITDRATLVVETARPMMYLIKNANTIYPADIQETSVLPLAQRSGTVTADPIDVSLYQWAYLYLQIDSSSGGNTLTINQIKRAPNLSGWTLTCPIWTGLLGTDGNKLVKLEQDELARNLELEFVVNGGGTFTYGLDVVLKYPIVSAIRSQIGTRTLFLGNQNVTINHGYPIIPGEEKIVGMAENTRLFAVAELESGVSFLPIHISEMGI